ncbi:MAG: hypothetical protein M0Z61_03610 [Nitrospiraceae bacterium]|nr:hypothetical protein [Nitrospiraceae bacterium]
MRYGPLLIICGGILLMAAFGLFVSIQDERRAKKYEEERRKEKLEMIADALKLLARKDKRVKEALMQVGFFRKKNY